MFGGEETGQWAEFGEGEVGENVVPARLDVKSGGLAPRNQLRQPGVVGVAGKVTRLNALVPKAREQNENRNERHAPNIGSEELKALAQQHGRKCTARN